MDPKPQNCHSEDKMAEAGKGTALRRSLVRKDPDKSWTAREDYFQGWAFSDGGSLCTSGLTFILE